MNGSVLSWSSQPGTRELLKHHAQGHGGQSTYQVSVLVFSSEQIPVTLLSLPKNNVNLPLSLCNEFIVNYPL